MTEMLRIVVDVDAPLLHAQGIKEDLSMYLERFGDTVIQSITEAPRSREEIIQIEMDEWRKWNAAYCVRP